jgi:hypothetical protein
MTLLIVVHRATQAGATMGLNIQLGRSDPAENAIQVSGAHRTWCLRQTGPLGVDDYLARGLPLRLAFHTIELARIPFHVNTPATGTKDRRQACQTMVSSTQD